MEFERRDILRSAAAITAGLAAPALAASPRKLGYAIVGLGSYGGVVLRQPVVVLFVHGVRDACRVLDGVAEADEGGRLLVLPKRVQGVIVVDEAGRVRSGDVRSGDGGGGGSSVPSR